MPEAEVTAYGEVVELEGLEVRAFKCLEDIGESVIIATQLGKDIVTSKYDVSEVLKTGGGDFNLGVLSTMRQQVDAHQADLILPD